MIDSEPIPLTPFPWELMKGRRSETREGAPPPLLKLFPLAFQGEGLNTMGSYMCSLVQKSANTNCRGRRSSSHEFTEVAVTHGVA